MKSGGSVQWPEATVGLATVTQMIKFGEVEDLGLHHGGGVKSSVGLACAAFSLAPATVKDYSLDVLPVLVVLEKLLGLNGLHLDELLDLLAERYILRHIILVLVLVLNFLFLEERLLLPQVWQGQGNSLSNIF